MYYLDTNILVYACINIDEDKMIKSQSLLKDFEKEIIISPLSLQELLFVLSKLKVDKKILEKSFKVYRKFCKNKIDIDIIDKAYDLSEKTNSFKDINDSIHLKIAERFCKKILTFDKNFKKFIDYSSIEIEILD